MVKMDIRFQNLFKMIASLMFLIVGCIVVNAKEENLLMVQILYRHGDRSPVRSFPKNPLPESAWPQGFGQLSERGMEQHYRLGRYLRSRYIEEKPFRLLNESYKRHEVTVRSTDYDRTLMSAYSNLAGLYPPSGGQVWNKDLLWQPIPVHTIPQDDDYLLDMGVTCPKYDQLYKEALQDPDIQEEERENKEFYKLVANLTGNESENITVAWGIFDPIFCARRHGLKEPEWSNRTWNNVTIFNKLRQINDLQFDVQYARKGESRLRGGPLLGEMVDNMQAKIRDETSDQKSFIYSAHDSTVSALLSAMNVFNGLAPPYASTIMVELLRVDGGHEVRVLYLNDSTHDPYELHIPGCGERCSFEKFVNLTKENIPINWYTECQPSGAEYETYVLTYAYIVFLAVGSVVIIAVLSLVVVCFAGLNVRCRKRHIYADLNKAQYDSA